MERLRDLSITPQHIDATYDEIHQVYDRYVALLSLVFNNKLCSAGEVTRAMGLSRTRNKQEYKSAQDKYKNWFEKGQLPYSIATIAYLYETGIFPDNSTAQNPKDNIQQDLRAAIANEQLDPFTYQNPNFRILNMICSYIYWKGHSESGQISVRINSFDEYFVELLRKLNAEPTISTRDDTTRVFMKSNLARLVNVLGIPVGPKSEAETTLPKLIIRAINSLNDEDSDQQEKEVAIQTICDFFLVAFQLGKCTETETRGNSIILTFLDSEELAAERIRLVFEAIKKSGLDIKLTAQKTSQMGGTNFTVPTYSHILFLDISNAKVQELKGEFQSRVINLL